jgi:hypothetical protein
LAELLIALLVLGLLATFTLPKVLTSLSNQTIKANGKEAVSTLSAVLYEGWQTGAIRTGTAASQFNGVLNFLKQRLNYTRFCAWMEVDGPCGGNPFLEMGSGYSRFILPSGAMITVYGTPIYTPTDFHFFIDANGNLPPNTEPAKGAIAVQSDIAALWFNVGQTTISYPTRYTNLRPGQLVADEVLGRNLVFEDWFK